MHVVHLITLFRLHFCAYKFNVGFCFFFQMFQTCQGHTEGEVSVTYVVITSHYLYLLKPSCKPNKFICEVAISFKELDYVSVKCLFPYHTLLLVVSDCAGPLCPKCLF